MKKYMTLLLVALTVSSHTMATYAPVNCVTICEQVNPRKYTAAPDYAYKYEKLMHGTNLNLLDVAIQTTVAVALTSFLAFVFYKLSSLKAFN